VLLPPHLREALEVERRHVIEDEGESESIVLRGAGDELALHRILALGNFLSAR